jgi:hypothetical protein
MPLLVHARPLVRILWRVGHWESGADDARFQYGIWKQAGIHSGRTQVCQTTMYVFDLHLDC